MYWAKKLAITASKEELIDGRLPFSRTLLTWLNIILLYCILSSTRTILRIRRNSLFSVKKLVNWNEIKHDNQPIVKKSRKIGRGRCESCGWKEDRKTTMKCEKCLKFIFNEHVKYICEKYLWFLLKLLNKFSFRALFMLNYIKYPYGSFLIRSAIL